MEGEEKEDNMRTKKERDKRHRWRCRADPAWLVWEMSDEQQNTDSDADETEGDL